MKQNKFSFAVIAILLIAFFTTSWVSPTPALKKTHITINSEYDFISGIYPFPGTFTISGAFETSGTVTMEADFNTNGTRAHCLYTFYDGTGTIIIREQCVFATPTQGIGRWEIVSGTGAYKNLRGNGSALMPDIRELWEGFIY
ncbi:MAG TPA: hypothetical protein VKB95_02025 [Chitinophagaceae bacterium]|nr:hypothetical protein [Chitinophagaceae bacterium]